MKNIFNLELPDYIIAEENEAIKRNEKLEKLFPSRDVPTIPEAFRSKHKTLDELIKGDVIKIDGELAVVVVTATSSKPKPYVVVRTNEEDFFDVTGNIHGDTTFKVIENVAN